MNLLRHLPNLITLLNLLCGVLAIIAVFQFNLHHAAWLILAGAVLDFLDGMVARLVGASGELGKQLDSLADVVTFGVAPGMIGYMLIADANGWRWYTFLPLLIPLFGALRLARFNIDNRQTDKFIGLPIPANALFWISLPLSAQYPSPWAFPWISTSWLFEPAAIAVAAAVLSFLMIAEIEMMALKFKHVRWNGNQWRYVFVLLSSLLLAFFFFSALPIILILYAIISLIQTATKS